MREGGACDGERADRDRTADDGAPERKCRAAGQLEHERRLREHAGERGRREDAHPAGEGVMGLRRRGVGRCRKLITGVLERAA